MPAGISTTKPYLTYRPNPEWGSLGRHVTGGMKDNKSLETQSECSSPAAQEWSHKLTGAGAPCPAVEEQWDYRCLGHFKQSALQVRGDTTG